MNSNHAAALAALEKVMTDDDCDLLMRVRKIADDIARAHLEIAEIDLDRYRSAGGRLQ